MQENPNMTGEIPKQSAQIHSGPSPVAFYLSIFAVLIVVAFSATMMALNMVGQSQITTAQSQIQEKDAQLATAKENKAILIADVLEKKLIPLSLDLKKVVTDFRMAARLAWVRLQGFSIQNNIITTSLTATDALGEAGHNDPVVTIIKMMRDYAQQDATRAFALEPIHTISGDETARTTNIQFRIIPQ